MKKIIIVILLGFLSFSLGSCKNPDPTSVNYSPNFNYTEISAEPSSLEDTVDKIYDSVVSIKTYINNKHYSSGSGIIISYDEKLNLSFILTCDHVIDGGTSFEAIVNNIDKPLEAKLVGGDKRNDVALLSIEGINYNYATINKEDSLRLASTVIAIGNPLGTLPGSVSIGHVSYLRREVMSSDYYTMELIQTDTAINSGNSGGGLFDVYGTLVGIVNAKFANTGVEGLGFAIPISTAFKVIDDIFKTAKYNESTKTWVKGYKIDSWELGFTVSDLISFPFKYVGISEVSANPNSSGYNMFMVGDQILKAYYKQGLEEVDLNISSSSAFYQTLYQLNLKVGDKFYMDINRNNQQQTIEVPLVQFIPN